MDKNDLRYLVAYNLARNKRVMQSNEHDFLMIAGPFQETGSTDYGHSLVSYGLKSIIHLCTLKGLEDDPAEQLVGQLKQLPYFRAQYVTQELYNFENVTMAACHRLDEIRNSRLGISMVFGKPVLAKHILSSLDVKRLSSD